MLFDRNPLRPCNGSNSVKSFPQTFVFNCAGSPGTGAVEQILLSLETGAMEQKLLSLETGAVEQRLLSRDWGSGAEIVI